MEEGGIQIMIADKIKNARTILYYITIIIVGIIWGCAF